ncbi:MAG: hypothetical protein J6M47_01025 [Clostridia bacterium]|nr:hypothetical protein [Clostridia bacterium]
MKAIKRYKWPLITALWALVLLPFFLGAPAAHPATDDFTFALYTHPTWVQTGSLPHVLKDALSYALRTWRDWQGTVTGVILMTLNPIVFSLEHYGWHAVLLLLLNLAAWLVFLRHMLVRRMALPAGLARGLAMVLSACLLMFLPDIVEGVYWFNGAWFYMGAQAVSLMTLVACDRLSESGTRGARLWLMAAICCGLLFALGMDNYITAMMTAAALFMMALQRAWAAHKTPAAGMIGVIVRGRMSGYEAAQIGGEYEKKRQLRAAVRTALLLLPIGAGLLLSVIAPGNSVRMETDGAHQSGMLWLLGSILWTMRDAAGYFLRFSVKTPLLAICLFVTPLLCGAMTGEKRRALPPIWATLLGTYLILCAMIIPHMYSSGYAGSGRVVNMYHCYVLVALPLALAMCIGRFPQKLRAWLAGKRALFGVLAAAALLACLAGGQIGNYTKLVRDQLDGTQAAYIAQFKHEYALCLAAGEEDEVILPAWTVQTVTGKPTAFVDGTMWTNEAMADYFGVAGVRVGE